MEQFAFARQIQLEAPQVIGRYAADHGVTSAAGPDHDGQLGTRAGVGRRICQGYTGGVRFEWDPDKAARNDAKDGVTFAEAASVFTDPLAALFDDEWHLGAEPREIIVGQSDAGRVLLVCFTERRHDTVRIISARPVTKRERNDYEQNIPG